MPTIRSLGQVRCKFHLFTFLFLSFFFFFLLFLIIVLSSADLVTRGVTASMLMKDLIQEHTDKTLAEAINFIQNPPYSSVGSSVHVVS